MRFEQSRKYKLTYNLKNPFLDEAVDQEVFDVLKHKVEMDGLPESESPFSLVLSSWVVQNDMKPFVAQTNWDRTVPGRKPRFGYG
jgi:hypothetical protein